jgi:hypothetical protein
MSSTVNTSFTTLRDTNRAALGCPSIAEVELGSRSRPFANDYRDHGAQPTR